MLLWMTVMNWLAVVFLNKVIKTKNFFKSPLPTAKLTHIKREIKQAIYISGSWFKNVLL